MQIVEGNLWDEVGKAGLILVTGNAIVTRARHLVMGRGAAKEATQRVPEIAGRLGQQLCERGQVNHRYGLLLDPSCRIDRTEVGIFQSKYHWRDAASLDLIEFSCSKVRLIAEYFNRIAINYPGIGCGYLDAETVRPILEGADLPDHVIFYQFPRSVLGAVAEAARAL